ncbi:TAP-like protein-domain-containing protein [Phaeosphaeria sp. MPI-PUGE-AT-0046c]|nr:TAP-like protein-domain-containing protein [Phaeosphaeria sp. MPI-PUGE-AT-0046c]
MRIKPFVYAGMVGLVNGNPLIPRRINASQSSWDQIQESTELQWQPCFDKYTCSRLIVPLDYANLSAGTTTIAYIKQAAQSSSSSAEDILINPGGPGGSGVDFLLAEGSMLSQLMPQYNIVGFDPRGVNNSGPALTCFGEDEASRALESEYSTQFIRSVDGKSERSLRYQFETSTAFGTWCTKFNENTHAKYASTVAVAQDMVHYTEMVAKASGKDPKQAKLNYYGVSYGTVLGATFASLFPTRLGRFVLDGVQDAQEYYSGSWENNLQSTDDVFNEFFKFCHAAGNDKCAIWSNSTDAISKRTRDILESIRQSPIPVADSTIVQYPKVITYEDIIFLSLAFVYSPLSNWPILAKMLSDIECRNGSSTAQSLDAVSPTVIGQTVLIGGMDAARNNREDFDTYEKWTAHLARMTKDSSWAADAWATLGLTGKNLEIYPPLSQQFNGTSFNVPTNAPILFVSNTLDPVTPLVGAQKMRDLFPGSGLLIQDAPGHCATLTAVSSCTLGHIGHYFATGQLPPPNTTCSVESVPFVSEGF